MRASFSRPTTAADGELSECGGEPRGILITELNYSGAEEEITEQRVRVINLIYIMNNLKTKLSDF